MALPTWLRPWRTASIPSTEVTVSPIIDFLSSNMRQKSPAELWRTQPHLRTVVDFLAQDGDFVPQLLKISKQIHAVPFGSCLLQRAASANDGNSHGDGNPGNGNAIGRASHATIGRASCSRVAARTCSTDRSRMQR